jgi:hypothetical protein
MAIDNLPDDLPLDEPTYSESDLLKARAEARAAAEKEAEGRLKELEAKLKETEAKLTEYAEREERLRREQLLSECKAFVEGLKKEGKLLPAWEKMGLVEFMATLDSSEELQFAEGLKTSRSEWFRKFLSELPKVVQFGEFAKRTDLPPGDLDELRQRAVREYMEKTGARLKDAFIAVKKERPELFGKEE